MKAKYFIVIIFLFCSCGKNNFNIKLSREEEYGKIYHLMNEIYNRAKENDFEYFKNTVGKIFIRDFESEDERTEWCNALRRINKKENYTNDEIIDCEIYEETESLMKDIVRANIVKTYKKRAFISSEGINFNYHWDNREIWFQMYIIKDVEDDEWKLSSLWHCR